ncbi:predicted protein [Chaetomium globosum CBS 148.51]|uniref:Amidoligase enzyme n=1 Tax=Chaetomium globosum (strain ATCC 6205 / CBS 148.51 / DSM 1962 / NBRC 6347 / NRRL 1970) TaxID=306901 RepID=Q2GNU4_CHAGB|nr:uncharacterized protein CHGG_10360 [Chaetomium globosum CBS 148.51]EAQ83956.1 predicted protein [Chaetomium globosum CBS 148.51]
MASASTSTAASGYAANPWFGIEIEIFVKLRDSVKKTVKDRIKNRKRVSKFFEKWQFDLPNSEGNLDKKDKQRKYVGQAIEAILDQTFGDGHGWKCTADASLKEYKLTLPPKPREWWGIEIISPPVSISSNWQTAIEQVFKSVTDTFNLWTNDFCATHVHVSVGPGRKAAYTLEQLMQVARGAYFFESPLRQLLPYERRENRYAMANWRFLGTGEYWNVGEAGWAPVWNRIALAGRSGKAVEFAKAMTVAEADPNANPRYRSTSFNPYERLKTIELRRQAGVASAKTAIRRVLLAVTLNVASLEYDFVAAGQKLGKTHLTVPDLISILITTLNTRLPGTCQGAAFKTWLEDCHRNYANDDTVRRFDEVTINEREKNYRIYGQANRHLHRGPTCATRRPPDNPTRHQQQRVHPAGSESLVGLFGFST